MASSLTSRQSWRIRLAVLLLAAMSGALPAAEAQHEPELRAIVKQAIEAAPCFADKYDYAVWHALQEPRLRRFVKDTAERMLILETAYCEATRPGEMRLPMGLVMAIMDVESRFDRWAVSSAGAVGLMQVMPFWPEQLGMQRRDLNKIKANMQMGCAILRHYLKREKNDWHKALARYNGSVGSRKYSDLVLNRWTTRWHGADDLGRPSAAAKR